MNRIKLFCLPYGGGSAAMYYDWKNYLDKNIELIPVEFPARGSRMGERNYGSLSEGVDDVFCRIKNDISQGQYAIFGHSLGGMIAFELAHKISDVGLPNPLHLFIAGRGAPHRPWHTEKKFYLLPEKEFREHVMTLGGIPKEFLNEPELLDMIFTLLREDYTVAETYLYVDKGTPLDYEITLFNAVEDEASREDIEAWNSYSKQKCYFHYFGGDHFFLRREVREIVNIINRTLLYV